MEIAELERGYREQNERLDEEQGRVESLRAELAASGAKLSERDAQLDDLHKRYVEGNARLDTETRRIEGLLAEISARDSLVSELRAARDAGQAEAERLRGDVFALSSELAELDHRHLKQTERLDDVIRRFKAERKKRRGLKSKLDRQLARAATQQASIDSLIAEKSAAEAKLAAIQSSRSWQLVSLVARFRRPLSVWNRSPRAKEADAPGNLPASPEENSAVVDEIYGHAPMQRATLQPRPVEPSSSRERIEGPSTESDPPSSSGHRHPSSPTTVPRLASATIRPGTSNAIRVAARAGRRDAAENEPGASSEPFASVDAAVKDERKSSSKKVVKASERRRPQLPAASPYSIGETELLERIRRYNSQKPTRKARVVVYTAIIGGYDPLIVPEQMVDDWDYVVFSDQLIKGEHVFEVRRPDYWNADPTRIARHAKMHPHIHFPDYEISIWIDSNILLRGNHLGDSARRFEEQGALFMSNPHPDRDCTYDELAKCLELSKDAPGLMKAQVERYRQEGLPEKYGMFETNILIRKHNDPQVTAFQALWWQEISAGSRRDQLSVMYSLWKLGLAHHRLTDVKDVRDHSENPYCLFPHKGKVSRKIPPYVAPAFMMNDVSQVFADDLRSLGAKRVRRVKHRLS